MIFRLVFYGFQCGFRGNFTVLGCFTFFGAVFVVFGDFYGVRVFFTVFGVVFTVLSYFGYLSCWFRNLNSALAASHSLSIFRLKHFIKIIFFIISLI